MKKYPNLPRSTNKGINKPHTWTKHNNKIKITVGNATLDEKLGKYYLDMTPALVHYTEMIYGDFDEKGIPLMGQGKEAYYFPICIAQYGFILHDIWIDNKHLDEYYEVMLNLLDWFEKNKEDFRGTYIWRTPKGGGHYPVPDGWTSAMAQGEIISFYLRMYQLLNQSNLLDTARKAYLYLKIDVENGGVRRFDENGYLWLEEYPTIDRPSFVLNGFIYALLGLYDLFRITKDNEVKKDIDDCIETLKANLHKYDAGYWSYYDQYYKELVQYYYQKNVHTPQLEALYLLTNEPIFNYYAKKWERTLTWYNYAFVQFMYRFLPRYRKIKNIIRRI